MSTVEVLYHDRIIFCRMFAVCEVLGVSPMAIAKENLPYIRRWIFWKLIKTNPTLFEMIKTYLEIDEQQNIVGEKTSFGEDKESIFVLEPAKEQQAVDDPVMNDKNSISASACSHSHQYSMYKISHQNNT